MLRVGPQTALDWALDAKEPGLSRFAAAQGALAAGRAGISLLELGRAAPDRPNGPAVFLEAATRAPRGELRAAFAAEASLVTLALEHGALGGGAEVREALRSAAVDLPSLLQRGALDPPTAAIWLGSPGMREALERASRWSLFRETGRPGPGLLPPLVEALNHLPSQVSIHPMVEIVALALQAVDRDGLERAIGGLTVLLERATRRDDRAVIMGEALGAVRRLLPPSGPDLVKLCFPAVYAAVQDGVRFPYNLLSWWFDSDWDRAKKWRHWLVDAWIEAGWAPLDLLRTVDATTGAEKLFAQVAKRSWRSRAGEALMRSIWSQLADAPDLAGRWRGPLERLMREGPPWVEYD